MSISRAPRMLGAALCFVGLTLGLALALGVSPMLRASADGPMQVAVAPASDIIDGQFVSVAWENFPAGGGVVLRQCAGDAKSWTDCSQQLQNELTRGDGSGSATFQVVATNGSDRILPGAPGVDCDFRNPCRIYVLPNASAQNLAGGAFATVRFAKPATACPTPGPRGAVGEGTDASARAFSGWQAAVCEEPYETTIDYTLKNDPSGRRDFQCGLRDFAVSANGFAEDEVCNPGDKLRKSVTAPLTVSALAFAFNVRDLQTNQRILDLRLTPELLAEIFTGQIRSWNDPRIAALNPDYTLPTKLRVVGRADRSAANLILTSYFWDNAQASYTAGGPAFQGGPTDTYPSVLSIDLRTYGPAVAEQVARPSENDPRIDPTYGFIGIVDTSVAALYGLPMAAIGDQGSGFVYPDAEAIRSGLEGMQEQPDGTLFPDVTPDTAGAYPMTTVSYGLLPSEGISTDLSLALKSFVTYGVTAGQEDLPAGYVPLPKALADESLDVIKDLPGRDVPVPGEPSPPPPSGDSGTDNTGGSAGTGLGGGFTTGDDLTGVAGSPESGGTPEGDSPVAGPAVTEISYLFGPEGLAGGPLTWLLVPLLGFGALGSLFFGGRMLRGGQPR